MLYIFATPFLHALALNGSNIVEDELELLLALFAAISVLTTIVKWDESVQQLLASH